MSNVAEARRYERLEALIASGRCVLLDGAMGSELIELAGKRPEVDEQLWGVGAVIEAPEATLQLHRRYVDIGCDVITTNTWAIPTAIRTDGPHLLGAFHDVHWMEVARRGISLARQAAEEGGCGDDVAVAFSVNGDIDSADGADTVRLLERVFDEESPDLILLETMSLVRSTTYATVEALVATGIPVWMSFRRCRHGVCGVYGEHWGGPEGDAFGRAARRFEELGISALAINCVPPDHVTGMISWLRDFTDLPLGVYPNLGYLSSHGWRNDHRIRGPEYAQMALAWRKEGAQIIGGCCGVGAEHLDAARVALEETSPGHTRPSMLPELAAPEGGNEPWTDARRRRLFPIDFPDLTVDPGVAAPTQASFMLWKYLYEEGIGARQRCVDIGSGTGVLAVQLARNGATHVHAIDIDPSAVRNTLINAYRNGVADRVTTAQADIFPWVPEERYDVVVSLLWQLPSDPFDVATSHRPRDFWGRNLIDHLIGLLPAALAEDGVAYVVQFSIVGEHQTLEQLERAGYAGRVIDYTFMDLDDGEVQEREQIRRVEAGSDAYHLAIGGREVMLAYLIEVRRQVATSW
jgi:S-methylmethionine-dependent homocysteine/selenocysteine methylase/SAM-dependent methyltransferase